MNQFRWMSLGFILRSIETAKREPLFEGLSSLLKLRRTAPRLQRDRIDAAIFEMAEESEEALQWLLSRVPQRSALHEILDAVVLTRAGHRMVAELLPLQKLKLVEG